MRISDWSSDVCSSDLIAFNIKETFLGESDSSGFALFVKHLTAGEFMQLHHLERYRHRISIEGNPLYYYAVIGHKLPPLREECPPPRGPGGVVVRGRASCRDSGWQDVECWVVGGSIENKNRHHK